MNRLIFALLFLFSFSLMAQPQPILRNAMSTNVAGTPVISQNNLSITNSVAGGTTNWLFYGTAPNTVARLVDIALGAGTLWATLVTQVDGTVTIYTNTSVTGTNIYGLSISASLVTSSNALQTSMSNTVGYVSNILNTGITSSSNKSHLDLTNLTVLVSNNMHLDLTNLNVATSNALQTSMSNTVGYVSNLLALGDISSSNQIHLDLTNLTVLVSNATHLDMTNLVNNAASNRIVVTAGASITVVTSSPAPNVIEYNVSADTVFGQAWFVWGSSNTLATNAAGVSYKAMQKSDQILPSTPNTNTYTTPIANDYIGEVITAIPVGVTALIPGDINTFSFVFLTENRTMVLQPEIYIRTNMIAPSWSDLGEREIGVGTQFTVNNVFTMYQVNVPLTTNVNLSVTNYLVRKYRVISVSGGTPSVRFVSQDGYPARVEFPIGSSSFVLRSGDTMTGNLTLPTAIATTSLIVTGSVISGNSQTSTVVNAQWNTLDNVSVGATIAGGQGNEINGTASDFATIGGGVQNSIVNGAINSTISGGSGNTIQDDNTYCFIGGGFLNSIDVGDYCITLGGSENNINGGNWNTILGGNVNEIADATGYSVISGGKQNRILGEYGSIIGGYLNTNASGSYGTILGGFSNRVAGDYAISAGALSAATANGAWMISDSTQTNKVNSTADSFRAKFSNGYILEGGYLNATLSSNYQTIWIDAGAMATNATGGPTIGYHTSTNFDGIYSDVWKYDSGTPQTNYFKLMFPDSWDNGTIKVKFFYFTTAVVASTSNVWAVCAQAVGSGDLYGFRGTEVSVTNLVQDTTNKLNICTSPAITVGGTPVLGDMTHFQIRRVADSGWDNSAGEAWLLGVAVQWQDKRNNPAVW